MIGLGYAYVQYKGYDLRRFPGQTTWGAYTGTFPADPWFEAEGLTELQRMIDEALADMPPPAEV